MLNVLITGGAGFIGSHLSEQLLQLGFNVTVLDNLSRGKTITDGVTFIDGDIRYRDAVDKAMEGADYVFHMAATNINRSESYPQESNDVNYYGSLNVFESALRHNAKKVIFSSSASVYGQPKELPMREDMELNPITPYCVAKLASEYSLKFYARKGLKYVILRYFNVYGPRQHTDAYYTSVIILFLKRLLAHKPPIVEGDGSQSMDFVSVKDIVSANINSMQEDVQNEIINIGSGVSTSIADLVNILADTANMQDTIPIFTMKSSIVTQRQADISKMKDLLKINPILLKDGIIDVVNYIVGK